MAKHIYLVKDSDMLVSHCRCTNAPITFPPQMDCPWCGCGWLFTCLNCRKSFTFARGIELDEGWDELAMRDMSGRGGKAPSAEDVREWIQFMQIYLKGVRPGRRYVALDGWVLDAEEKGIRFEGWHSTHQLACVPQVEAVNDQTILQNILANRRYWEDHATKSD